MANLKYFIQILGDSKQAVKEIKKVSGEFRSLGKTALKISAGLSAIFTPAIISAQKFQKQVAEITTLGVKNVEKLGNDLTDLMSKYGQTIEGITKSAYDSVSAGIPEKELKDWMELVNKVAIAGKTTASVTADLLTSMRNAWKLSMEQIKEEANSVFVAVKYGKTTVDAIASSIGDFAGVAALLGVSTKEALSALSALTLGGLSTAEAGTQLKAVMNALINPSKKLADQIKAWGYENGQAMIKALGLAGVLEKIRKEFGNDATALGELFPNIRALSGISYLTGTQFEKFRETLQAMRNDTETLSQAFEKMANTFAFKVSQIWATMKAIAIKFGEPIITAFKPSLDYIYKILRGIFEFFKKRGTEISYYLQLFIGEINEIIYRMEDFIGNLIGWERFGKILQVISDYLPVIIANLIILAPILAGIGTVLVGIGAIVPLISSAVAVIGTAGATIGGIIIGLITIKGILDAIAGIITAKIIGELLKLRYHTDSIKTAISLLFADLKVFLEDIAGDIKAFWSKNKADIQEAGQILYETVYLTIKDIVNFLNSLSWDKLINAVKEFGAIIGDVFMVIVEIIRGDFDKAWEYVKKFINSIIKGFQAIGDFLLGKWRDKIINIFAEIVAKIMTGFAKAKNFLYSIFMSIKSAINDYIIFPIEYAIRKINTLLHKLAFWKHEKMNLGSEEKLEPAPAGELESVNLGSAVIRKEVNIKLEAKAGQESTLRPLIEALAGEIRKGRLQEIL